MAMTVVCPSCARKLNVPDNLMEELVKCPICGQNFKVESEPAAPVPEVQPLQPQASAPPKREPIEPKEKGRKDRCHLGFRATPASRPRTSSRHTHFSSGDLEHLHQLLWTYSGAHCLGLGRRGSESDARRPYGSHGRRNDESGLRLRHHWHLCAGGVVASLLWRQWSSRDHPLICAKIIGQSFPEAIPSA